jgi:hypothetical protein
MCKSVTLLSCLWGYNNIISYQSKDDSTNLQAYANTETEIILVIMLTSITLKTSS